MDNDSTVSDRVEVAGAPDIPGLTFRRFRGAGDFPAMAAVIQASKVADNIERVNSVDDLARAYAHLVNSDADRDMLFVEIDGEVVGYNRVWWGREENGPWTYSHVGFLKPAWRGRGLGRAALAYLEEHLRQIAASHVGDGQRFFNTDAADTETAREALLLGAGYQAVRHGFNMVRPLTGAEAEPVVVSPMPDGLATQPATPEHYRAIWEADGEAFRDHWGYVPPTEADYQGWLDNSVFNPALWQVAWDQASGQVAGMVLNFVSEPENEEYHRRRGYTEGISVRRPWRKRGLARALLTRSLQMFKDMGMTEAALGVDSENLSGALRLYESVGFRVAKRQTVYRKPL